VTQAEATEGESTPRPYRLGSRVRIVPRERLEAALLAREARLRPTPVQCQAAGRTARVTGVVLDGATPMHRLDRIPGLWPGDWLERLR